MKTEQRVIKYRAWNERFNEMWDCDRLALNRIHMSVTGNGFLTHDEDGALELLPFLKPMQFTGLVDKEGNDLYEFDIVSCDGRQRTIKWANGKFWFVAESSNQHEDISEIFGKYYSKVKLIGNTFQGLLPSTTTI